VNYELEEETWRLNPHRKESAPVVIVALRSSSYCSTLPPFRISDNGLKVRGVQWVRDVVWSKLGMPLSIRDFFGCFASQSCHRAGIPRSNLRNPGYSCRFLTNMPYRFLIGVHWNCWPIPWGCQCNRAELRTQAGMDQNGWLVSDLLSDWGPISSGYCPGWSTIKRLTLRQPDRQKRKQKLTNPFSTISTHLLKTEASQASRTRPGTTKPSAS
jgi:hypothetical protein